MCLVYLMVVYKYQPHGSARGKFRGPLRSLRLILWGIWWSAQNFLAIPPIVVELFLSGAKWWTSDQQSNPHDHPSSHAAIVAKNDTYNW